jgi:hypothetical protein
MRTIKLMADYQCHPLWEANPGVYGDISPESLPISLALREQLQAWARQYDATLDIDDPASSGFDSKQSADNFVADGYGLLAKLKQELGPEFQVTSFFKANPRRSAK